MSLSEKDLLLLDCFMYADITPYNESKYLSDVLYQFYDEKEGKITEESLLAYRTQKGTGIHFSGDMDAKKMADVMNQMLKSEDLKKLKITHTTEEYEGSIRAACFYDESTKKATVAFRGTGGSYAQWYNNLEGYGELSTETQEDAVTFINSLPYTGIDVTGHSNGGGQAMYVTIICGEKISRCVSFEGQGISKNFYLKNKDLVDENKAKIKNISAYNDPVNAVLLCIAGEKVYVKSNDGIFSHGGYTILTANTYDDDGNFSKDTIISQSIVCQAINALTILLEIHSDVPVVGEVIEFFADFIGIGIGLGINGNYKKLDNWVQAFEDYVQSTFNMLIDISTGMLIDISIDCVQVIKDTIDFLRDTYGKVKEWYDNNFNIGYKYANANPQLIVDTYKLEVYAQRIQEINRRVSNLDSRLDALYWKVGLVDLWSLIQADLLTGYNWRLGLCVSYLYETADDFEAIENILVSNI